MASKIDKQVHHKNPLDFISIETNNSFTIQYIAITDVSKLIQNLDCKKACGYDLISNRILKSSCNILLSANACNSRRISIYRLISPTYCTKDL